MPSQNAYGTCVSGASGGQDRRPARDGAATTANHVRARAVRKPCGNSTESNGRPPPAPEAFDRDVPPWIQQPERIRPAVRTVRRWRRSLATRDRIRSASRRECARARSEPTPRDRGSEDGDAERRKRERPDAGSGRGVLMALASPASVPKTSRGTRCRSSLRAPASGTRGTSGCPPVAPCDRRASGMRSHRSRTLDERSSGGTTEGFTATPEAAAVEGSAAPP